MINNQLVQNYTSALFENALAAALEEKILTQIKRIDVLIQGDQKIKDIMLSPIAKYRDKLTLIELITKHLNTELIVKQFLLILLKHSRLSILPNIVSLYQDLLNKNRNVKIVKITSSKLLQAEEKNWLKKYLEENFHQKVAINFELNPSIIGGIILQYDSLVKDYSIAGFLKKVNNALINTNGE
ncbi:ATP synthase F1 subunit delta [Candidatus Tisiphia endosymbiont of Beris chalybata]|uniref:ATP synthase F1 subunit delta n=1 Tax=Candidatus Tisiphia endosymbiont of Beris chalybata TaxID=3066262 RepID=UPI00312CAD36